MAKTNKVAANSPAQFVSVNPDAAPAPVDVTALSPEQHAQLILAMRSATDLNATLKVMGATDRGRAKSDAVYELNLSRCELPNKRGACAKVYATAVRKNAPFTAQDIADALPEVKSAKFWTRKLAKLGFFSEVAEG